MSRRSAVEILSAAKARIADPDRWCQRAEAVDANGDRVSVHTESAVRWCAVGALYAEGYGSAAFNALEYAALALGYESPAGLNDDADHATVMRLYDAAIALAEGGTS